jgi:hypothetical protein
MITIDVSVSLRFDVTCLPLSRAKLDGTSSRLIVLRAAGFKFDELSSYVAGLELSRKPSAPNLHNIKLHRLTYYHDRDCLSPTLRIFQRLATTIDWID